MLRIEVYRSRNEIDWPPKVSGATPHLPRHYTDINSSMRDFFASRCVAKAAGKFDRSLRETPCTSYNFLRNRAALIERNDERCTSTAR